MAEKQKTEKITVVAKQAKGFWRAGLFFSNEPTTVDVTEDQRKTIEAEPMLAVVPNPKEEKKPGA